MGDEVAYILKLHEESERDHGPITGEVGPKQVPQVSFRQCEPCRVQTITYAIWPGEIPAQQFTVARVELVLINPQRGARAGGASSSGSELKLTVDIPPPIAEFPEFVVPMHSYAEGCRRVFSSGDAVKTYMLGSDSRSEWYQGKIKDDKLAGRAISGTDLLTTDQTGRYQVRSRSFLTASTHPLMWHASPWRR